MTFVRAAFLFVPVVGAQTNSYKLLCDISWVTLAAVQCNLGTPETWKLKKLEGLHERF
jgi:hypothetical protein